MRELYKMEFIGDIKIEDLDPIGYKISIYTSRGSENPIAIIADLPDEQFLPYIKEELRYRKLHKTKYFSTVKIPKEGSNTIPYHAVNNQYETQVSAPPIFLKFKDKHITIPYHSKGIMIPVLSNTYWKVMDSDNTDYSITYRGNGSEYIILYPKVNHSKDKHYQITLVSKNNNLTATLEICQIGMREPFRTSEGSFILVDQREFLVLKNGVLE